MARSYELPDRRASTELSMAEARHYRGCRLEAFELSYWVHGRDRDSLPTQLLNSVSLSVIPGESLAIVGPSGAGKSTLLDVLAARKRNGLLHGVVTLNGQSVPHGSYQSILFRRNVAYVLQGDSHFPHLTVQETVAFATALRLDGFATADVHEARVGLILKILRLEDIADVRVGDRKSGEGGRGLTDGEMKRLSVAVEIVSLPALIFADEPTTGLDSPTAYDVMRSVLSLTKEAYSEDSPPIHEPEGSMPKGNPSDEAKAAGDFALEISRTVIATVHQPSAEIFNLFSKVLVLAQGELLFFGAVGDVFDYFSSPGLNYIYEEGSNPADFALMVAGGGLVAEGQDQPTAPRKLAAVFQQSEYFLALPSSPGPSSSGSLVTLDQVLGTSASNFPPLEIQFKLLLHRAWLSTSRRVDVLVTQLTKAVIVGLLIGLVYHEVFKHTDHTWVNLFDSACSIGNGNEERCLVDIPLLSSVGVRCEYGANRLCRGFSRANFGGPWLANKVVVGAVCSLAPVLLGTNGSISSPTETSSVCTQLSEIAGGGQDHACTIAPSLDTCVHGNLLGTRLSPYALNASSMFFLAVLYMIMGNSQEIPRLIETRKIVRQELSAGAYKVAPLWASQLLVHLPVQILLFSVFFNLCYWLIGIPYGQNMSNYFYCFFMLLSTNSAGFALAQLFAVSLADWALALFPVSLIFLSSFSGYSILVQSIPLGWRWGRYVSFFRFSFEGLVTQVLPEGVAKYFGFTVMDPAWHLFIVLLFCAAFNLTTFFFLREGNKTKSLAVVPLSGKRLADFKQDKRANKPGCQDDSNLDLEAVPATETSGSKRYPTWELRQGTTAGERAAEDLARLHPFAQAVKVRLDADRSDPGMVDEETGADADAAAGGPKNIDIKVSDFASENANAEHLVGSRLRFQDIHFYVSGSAKPAACGRLGRLRLKSRAYGRLQESNSNQATVEEKELLNGVSGIAEPGKILAVAGPSGAGKSTLVEILAGWKHPSEGRTTGEMTINGRSHEAWNPDSSCAYVAQENVQLVGHLTVRETIEISVALRLIMPTCRLSNVAKAGLRSHRVSLLLDLFFLRPIEHLLVSSTQDGDRALLSGGEAKRLAIAVELVSLPSTIFLDEPTSGLDSMAAFEVASAIRALANQSRTIVTTIHQPSVSTFALFDDLLLLNAGYCAYFGPLCGAVAYFHLSDMGLNYRPGLNPADFLVAAVASQSGDCLDKHFRASPQFTSLQTDLAASQGEPAGPVDNPEGGGQNAEQDTSTWPWWAVRLFEEVWGSHQYPSTFFEQVRTLVRRNLVFAMRAPRGMFGQLLRHLAVGLFFGSLYRTVPGTTPEEDSQNLASLLFFSVFFLAVGHQHTIPMLIGQRHVWQHEQDLGLYSNRALYVSQVLERWPLELVCVALYSSIVYLCCSLRPTFDAFAFFTVVLSLASLASLSLCELIASVAPSAQAAISLFLSCSFFFIVSGGYVVLIPTLPREIREVLPAVSYVRWAFQGLLINQYEGDSSAGIDLSVYGFEGERGKSIVPLLLSLFSFEVLKVASMCSKSR